MTGGPNRARLKEALARIEQTSKFCRTLIFVNDDLLCLDTCEWEPAERDWKLTMRSMRAQGATGYFVALRRTRRPAIESYEDFDELQLLGDHVGLALIDTLRWH